MSHQSFPQGSIRRAVAVYGDNWALSQEPTDDDVSAPNWAFRVERADADVMRRAARSGGWQLERGTIWDPRVWIGVPLTERHA
jgi:hypothetical protein